MFAQEEKPPAIRFFVMCDEEGQPLLGDGESVLHRSEAIELAFVAGTPPRPVGLGAVVVTSQRLLWLGETRSFAFSVPSILLHAVTSDPDSYPRPCLYCQLDLDQDQGGLGYGDSGSDDDDSDEEGGEGAFIDSCSTGELFLAPPVQAPAQAETETEAGALQALFKALSDAALLCPDPDDEDKLLGAAGDWITADSFAGEAEEGLAGEGFITTEEDLRGLDPEQQRAMAHWDTIFVPPSEQP